MIHIELTLDDADVLARALEHYLSDLRMEIADTDRMEFRDALKRQKKVLVRILGELTAVEAEAV